MTGMAGKFSLNNFFGMSEDPEEDHYDEEPATKAHLHQSGGKR